ncbi:MAG: ribbon-helix-helix domain-containing protein [Methanocellales archaeon]|nr:ribbon-helix-helix domain-containing protein [Methanocellales archaeon]
MSDTVAVGTKLTKVMVEEIDRLVKDGVYTSRSEALRDATRLLVRAHRGGLRGKITRTQFTDEEREEALKEFIRQKGLEL